MEGKFSRKEKESAKDVINEEMVKLRTMARGAEGLMILLAEDRLEELDATTLLWLEEILGREEDRYPLLMEWIQKKIMEMVGS